MLREYVVNGATCHRCKAALVRVPQSIYPIAEFAPDDAIVCVDCGAAGSLTGVLAQGDWLLADLLTAKQCAEIAAVLRTV